MYDSNKISISLAAKHGDWMILKSLLNQGVHINAIKLHYVNNDNQTIIHELYTALISAVTHGQHDIIHKILQIPEIDINLCNLEGRTALIYAAGKLIKRLTIFIFCLKLYLLIIIYY